MTMNPRIAGILVGAMATVSACATTPRGPSPGDLRAMATHDSLVAVRDSLSAARLRILALDSLVTPLTLTAPDSFLVVFETTRGRFDVMIHSRWAPLGVDRFYDLVRRRFYDDVTVFRIEKGFVAQFGISGDPAVSAAWRFRRIPDDPIYESNIRGRLSYASAGPNTRSTQLFINFKNNPQLDAPTGGYPPIGQVVAGMDVVDSLYAEYGNAPANAQVSIQAEGNAFLRANFPKLDVIRTARIVREWRRPPAR
jgi:peptidyl-prolyl cis-trans isomerase A (cyclophilin A)